MITKVVQMSLEEFSDLSKKTDWNNLNIGDIYVDKDEKGKWVACEVTDIVHGYGNGRPEITIYPLQIV